MFGTQSSYDNEVRRRIKAEIDHDYLLSIYNALVRRINRLGGEEFLENATLNKSKTIQFDKSDLNTLLNLCHPDKHNGKPSANNMTIKIIELRKEL